MASKKITVHRSSRTGRFVKKATPTSTARPPSVSASGARRERRARCSPFVATCCRATF